MHTTAARRRDDGELAQDLRRLDLAFFEPEPLALEGPEQLLDVPAAAIVGDGLVGLRNGVDRGAGQQPPVDRNDARRRIVLAHVKGMERDALLQIGIDVFLRPRQGDRAMAQNHRGAPRGTAGNRRQIEREVIGDRKAVEMLEQVPAIGQAALGLGAHQQFNRGGPPRKGRIEIALAIGDDANRRGAGRAQARGRGGAHQPTVGLFLVRRAPCMLCRRTVSFPQLHIEQPQNDAAVGINHQHRMNEEGRIDAVPAATERGFATLMLESALTGTAHVARQRAPSPTLPLKKGEGAAPNRHSFPSSSSAMPLITASRPNLARSRSTACSAAALRRPL